MMTKQEKEEEIAKLQNKINELQNQIERDKEEELENFLDDACGNYVTFVMDGNRYYMYVNKREGDTLCGNSIYTNEYDMSITSEDWYDFRENDVSDFSILTKNDALELIRKLFEEVLASVEY